MADDLALGDPQPAAPADARKGASPASIASGLVSPESTHAGHALRLAGTLAVPSAVLPEMAVRRR